MRSIALRVLLPAMYLSPAILIGLQAGGDFSKDIVWLLPLLALCLSGTRSLEWSLPSRWQWPLITLATLVSIAWPTNYPNFVVEITPTLSPAAWMPATNTPWQVGTQNVVTMPVWGSSTSSAVGTPSVGQAPRGGM